jgi:hypothetical protein
MQLFGIGIAAMSVGGFMVAAIPRRSRRVH